MEIQIPSPSVFLRRSPVLSKANTSPPAVKKESKTRGSTTTRTTTKTAGSTSNTNAEKSGIVKPKQSKSRNGCMTCKKKRLKCDETKPTCLQCEKRNVDCEGYKKEYKWRQFDEITKVPRAGKAKRTLSANNVTVQDLPSSSRTTSDPQISTKSMSKDATVNTAAPAKSSFTEHNGLPEPRSFSNSPVHLHTASQFDPLPILNPGFTPSEFDLPSPQPQLPLPTLARHRSSGANSDRSLPEDPPFLAHPSSPPGFAMPHNTLPGSSVHGQDSSDLFEMDFNAHLDEVDDPDFDEEIVRDVMPNQQNDFITQQWQIRAPSPANSEASSISSASTDMSILRVPSHDATSNEMLLLRFDRLTCDILSVRGGSNNPWRTIIWSMARDSDALRHAVLSMTGLHGGTTDPHVRNVGLAHMHKCFSKLKSEIGRTSKMTGLATTLALALGEGWDEGYSTGVQHLKGAKIILSNALAEQRNQQQMVKYDSDPKILQFLGNTYVYLDVIARLTSVQEQEPLDLDYVLAAINPGDSMITEIDPLMGCATTLFPLIGQVATLVQQVRLSESNSLDIISEARDLRDVIQHWQPPDKRLVDDNQRHAEQAVQTAEAYRRAILLHLHQAVPELPCEGTYQQAKDIMTVLSTTPLDSPTLIVQIFPLLVGSCEMVSAADRKWVEGRWEAMLQRLNIANVVLCWELVREVWRRRDQFMQEQIRREAERLRSHTDRYIPAGLKRKMASLDPAAQEGCFNQLGPQQDEVQDGTSRSIRRRLTDVAMGRSGMFMPGIHGASEPRRANATISSNVEPEYTVRGELHWLTVMTERNWEVFLG